MGISSEFLFVLFFSVSFLCVWLAVFALRLRGFHSLVRLLLDWTFGICFDGDDYRMLSSEASFKDALDCLVLVYLTLLFFLLPRSTLLEWTLS